MKTNKSKPIGSLVLIAGLIILGGFIMSLTPLNKSTQYNIFEMASLGFQQGDIFVIVGTAINLAGFLILFVSALRK